MPPPSQQLRRRPPASGAHGRRHAALAALSAPAVAWGPPAPARAAAAAAPAAKIGYQLKLPDKWEQVQGRGAPKLDDATARTLLVARLEVAQLEALVTRIPLAVSQRDPQGIGGLASIEFFTQPEPRVSRDQVVDLLSKGYASMPATFTFSLGASSERQQWGSKYLRFDFDVSRCEGTQMQGTQGKKSCRRPDNGEDLPTPVRHHAVIYTLAVEPIGNERVADGMLTGDDGAQVLYALDISAPAEVWARVTEDVDFLIRSFAVGSEAQLERARVALNDAAPAKVPAVA